MQMWGQSSNLSIHDGANSVLLATRREIPHHPICDFENANQNVLHKTSKHYYDI